MNTATKSSWLTIEAIALIVLGLLAIVFPLFAGIAVGVFIGWVLIVVGLIGLVSAFAGRDHAHFAWSAVSAAIAVLAGLLLVFHPLVAAVAVTVIVAAYLLIDGVALIGLGLDQRNRKARHWYGPFGSGVLDILLALLILALGAAGSAVLIGIIIGVDLIAAGIGLFLVHRAGTAAVL